MTTYGHCRLTVGEALPDVFVMTVTTTPKSRCYFPGLRSEGMKAQELDAHLSSANFELNSPQCSLNPLRGLLRWCIPVSDAPSTSSTRWTPRPPLRTPPLCLTPIFTPHGILLVLTLSPSCLLLSHSVQATATSHLSSCSGIRTSLLASHMHGDEM